jgi:hypothetical protein
MWTFWCGACAGCSCDWAASCQECANWVWPGPLSTQDRQTQLCGVVRLRVFGKHLPAYCRLPSTCWSETSPVAL